MTTPTTPKRMLTVKEFCTQYSVSKTTAYKLIALGQLQALHALGRTLIPVESAEAWAAMLPALPSKKCA